MDIPWKNNIPSDGVLFRSVFKEHQLVLRVAQHEDYAAVINIRHGVYDGRDYVPSYYHEIIGEPQTVGLVAAVDGEIVYFSAVKYGMDGGRICTNISNRIHPDWSGTGLFEVIRQQQSAAVKKLFPMVQREWSVSLHSDRTENWYNTHNGRILGKWTTVVCTGSMESLRMKSQYIKPVYQVQPLSLSSTLNIFKDKSIVEQLFPNGFLISSDKNSPVKTTEADLRKEAQMCEFFVTYNHEKEGCRVLAISSSYFFIAHGGIVGIMQFYGAHIDDLLLSHIINHITYYFKAAQGIDQQASSVIGFPSSFNINLSKNMFMKDIYNKVDERFFGLFEKGY